MSKVCQMCVCCTTMIIGSYGNRIGSDYKMNAMKELVIVEAVDDTGHISLNKKKTPFPFNAPGAVKKFFSGNDNLVNIQLLERGK